MASTINRYTSRRARTRYPKLTPATEWDLGCFDGRILLVHRETGHPTGWQPGLKLRDMHHAADFWAVVQGATRAEADAAFRALLEDKHVCQER